MAADVSKNLERAKKFLEKNRVEDAIEAYLSVLEDAPQHLEATQALGDLYTRLDQPGRALIYYGYLFELLVEPKDETKALAIYNRFLRNSTPQPPERIARYAFLQQKQNHPEEAIEQYTKAAEMFNEAGRVEDALFCWERTAQLDPDNSERQLKVAEGAAKLGKNALAARAFLRAGTLAAAGGAEQEALKLLGRAYSLAPKERSVALLYAEAKLRNGDSAEAAALLEPFAPNESDPVFLETFADALHQAGQLDRARGILERLLREKNEGITRLFGLADAFADAGQDHKSVEILMTLKRRMFADKKQNQFIAQVEDLGAKHPESLPILDFWAAMYSELNRESQYFEVLIKLFDANFNSGNFQKSSEVLERLVDIDSYDYRNQQRLEKLRGHADEGFLKRVANRMAKTATVTSHAAPPPKAMASQEMAAEAVPVTEEGRKMQALEDLIVQTEIFLQYSLQSKAVERLQKIAAMFPGEEDRNARLHNLYQLANWWPKSQGKPAEPTPKVSSVPVVEAQPTPPAGRTGTYTAETLRDLTKISEINQKTFRQQTPRAMLNTTVTEVGTYMKAARTLAVIGEPGRPPELAAEYCGAGLKTAPGAQVVFLIAQMEKAMPDELGGLVVNASEGSILTELGLATALGVTISDKETQAPAGMLIVAHSAAHSWKPNETFFLQAIGDQMILSVSHTRLRSLVRRMGVSDDRTGLMSRSSYVGCLLNEADRARTQGTPLSLAILQIDRGSEMLRQQGESPLEKFLEQLSRSLQPMIRQNDVAVKYTSWALAFILPDTNASGAHNLVEKLRRAAAGVRPPWDSTQVTLSAGIVEAAARQEYESEDIVTDLINRAEFSMEEARKQGGDTVVVSEASKP